MTRDFRLLRSAQLVNLLGTQISVVALPFVALTVLHADALAVSLLVTFQFLFAPFASVLLAPFIDRGDMRQILMALDAIRAAVVALVPLGAAAHVLDMRWLYGVALVVGTATAVADVTRGSFIVRIVERTDLGRANSQLSVISALAALGGQSLAGALVQLVGAVTAVLLDAASYAVSLLTLAGIRRPQPVAPTQRSAEPYRVQLLAGVHLIRGSRLIVAVLAMSALLNLGGSMIGGVFIVFAYRDLGLSPLFVGVILGVGNVVAIPVAVGFRHLSQRVALSTMIRAGAFVAALSLWLIPLAGQVRIAAGAILIAYEILFYAGAVLFVLATTTYRQLWAPEQQLARVNAVFTVAAQTSLPLGAALGGVVALRFGTPAAIVSGCLVATLGIPALVISSVGASTESRLSDPPPPESSAHPAEPAQALREPT